MKYPIRHPPHLYTSSFIALVLGLDSVTMPHAIAGNPSTGYVHPKLRAWGRIKAPGANSYVVTAEQVPMWVCGSKRLKMHIIRQNTPYRIAGTHRPMISNATYGLKSPTVR